MKKGIILVLVITLILIIGTSFALWNLTFRQTGTNQITTDCFKIEFQDDNPISLQEIGPITDEEAVKLIPYNFTITNMCDSIAGYTINLETLNNSTLEDLSIIKMLLNDATKEEEPKLLTENDQVEKTLTNARASYKLETGYLNTKESKTYNLRLWMSVDTPPSEKYMSKTFESKITIITSYLKEIPRTVTEKNREYMLSKAKEGTLIEDETEDHNLRYVGRDPNNYVTFNNQTTWRIVGIMNNIDDGTGKKESRLKLVGRHPVSMANPVWDTSPSNINSGYGVNEWSQADLMKLLNPGYESESIGGSLYWNNGGYGSFYNGSGNVSFSANFASYMTDEAKKMIKPAVWNTGSDYQNKEFLEIILREFYTAERSGRAINNCTDATYCNDTVERKESWIGYVGLPYASDLVYALDAKSNTDTNREFCINQKASLYSAGCSSWFESSTYTLTSYQNTIVVLLDKFNTVRPAGNHRLNTNPTVYLSPDVQIVGGEGTISSPFILSQK